MLWEIGDVGFCLDSIGYVVFLENIVYISL